jgi:alanine racemase
MAVVKADAYGHGAVSISQEMLKLGVEYLAVSNIDEAIELRDSGISCAILILGPVETQEFGKLIQFNIYPTVISLEYAKELSESYKYRGVYPKVHIKIDSGMGRLGIPIENALLEIEQIANIEGVIIDGLFTHFPSAENDREFSLKQLNAFANLVKETKRLGIKIKHFHIANSAAIFNIPESYSEPFTMIRPGLSIYGYSTSSIKELQNSMSLKARIVSIKKLKKGQSVSYLRTYTVKADEEYIAVIPVGYADGIPVVYSNKGKVIIGDFYYPVVGRICMDYMMISLGKNEYDVAIGDEVTIFGKGKLSVEQFGKLCNKIPYEVTCGISKRVPRIFTRKEDERQDI